MKHRIISLAVSLALTMGIASVGEYRTAAEAGGEAMDLFFAYTNHGDSIEITGADSPYIRAHNGHFSYGMSIPEEIDGLPVTAIAEGGLSEIRMRQMIWPDWITTIPANCFQNCKNLETIIIPETVTCIEAGAFDGCKNLHDVMYKGDDAAWDAVIVGARNNGLENAHILTNFNRQDVRNTEFVFGEDNWSFRNGDLTKYIANTETIESYLEGCHPESIEWHQKLTLPGYYAGACSGFAMTSYLVCCGIIKPSDIYEGAETLHEIPLCDEAIEAITYYQSRCTRGDLVEARNPEMMLEYLNSGAFFSDLEQGKPLWLSYMIPELGGHAVVAYGLEEGEWEYEDVTYTSRILVYDSNAGDYHEDAFIYYNEDSKRPYVPYLESVIGFSVIMYEPDRLPYGIRNFTTYQSTYVLGDLNTDGDVNAVDAANILTAAASVGAGEDSTWNNGQKSVADVNEDGGFDAVDAALILQYAAYAGASGELSFEEYLAKQAWKGGHP